MSHQSDKTQINKCVVTKFLNGTHSHNSDDIEVIDETVDEGIVCHGFPGKNPRDRESYKEFFRDFQRHFADMEFTLFSLVAADDYVCARWRIEARHVGAFAGVEATRREVCFDGMVQYRLEDGLIAETWLYMDQMKLLSDIGAIHPTAEAA